MEFLFFAGFNGFLGNPMLPGAQFSLIGEFRGEMWV
jgi:hypothetical protein